MFEDFAFRVAVSMSYICLFVVLIFYKYEVIFRTGVIIVAVVGFFFPVFYWLPYILIVWRVLVGMNVATDQKLYIARCIQQIDMDKEDFFGCTSLNHWAVVIQDGAQYFLTQAVGTVISGKGIKIPFRKLEKDTLLNKYRLNHVGFVTQKQRETKGKELVDDEPMVSGNSCQEYAVDIAFQLSSSRTYTFVKIMALNQYRNIAFYIVVMLSIVFNMALDYPSARLLNPLCLANLYAALELSRIGIHNQTQSVNHRYVASVIRAYITYPTRGNFFVLLLIFVSFAYLYIRLGFEDLLVLSSLFGAVVLALLK
jgi:hypothetical protein